jgi:hypothetical protein
MENESTLPCAQGCATARKPEKSGRTRRGPNGLCSEGAARRAGIDPARESQRFGATARNSTLGRCLRVAANDSGHLRFPHCRPFSRRRGYGRSRRRRSDVAERVIVCHLTSRLSLSRLARELAGVDFPLGMVLASVTSSLLHRCKCYLASARPATAEEKLHWRPTRP